MGYAALGFFKTVPQSVAWKASFEDRDIAAEFIPSNERIGNMVTCSVTVLLERLNEALREGMKLPSIRKEKFEQIHPRNGSG